jgi:hypothetical protein
MEPRERREKYVNPITKTDQVIGNKDGDAAE